MCYCHCSLSQIHANTPTICCNTAATAATTQTKNCTSGFGGGLPPINWDIFQNQRCQCGVCELNFLRNLNRLSSPNITEFLKYKNQNIEKFIEMSSTTPLAQNHKRKRTSRSNSNSKDIPQLLNVNVVGKNSEDLNLKMHQSSTKELSTKEISDKKEQDIFTNKKNKKKKKKKHKKSKYKSSKSDRTDGEFIKKKKSRKHKRNKKDCKDTSEFETVVRSSSLKSINEDYSKVSKTEVENFSTTPEIKVNDYEEIYHNDSPSSEISNQDLSPIFTNNLKTSEKLSVERKFSRSPSVDTLSDYPEYNKKSKLQPHIGIADSVNKNQYLNKQEWHHSSQGNRSNTPEILSPQKKSTREKSSELLIQEKLSDNSNSRNFKNLESRQSTDTVKSSNFPSNNSKETGNRSSKNLSYAKGIAPSLESFRNNKNKSSERQFDSYNENAISGKDLDSYVNAIMIDEYKEKKLNDFKLLEELKNNIAIKAKEKIKSIEKISNDNFSTIPSVNKFISGILSSPDSINNNFPTVSNLQLKNLPKDNSEKKCKFIEKNLTITKEIPEKSHSPSQSRSIDNEDNKNVLNLKVKKKSRSRSKSRYSTDSNESSPRSKYSYSSSRYSSRYSRSSSGSSHISTSNSRTRSRTYSRSPSIPRRRGSPSFLERRRITSARKRPIPYNRIPNSSNDQFRQIVCNSYTTIIRKYQPAT